MEGAGAQVETEVENGMRIDSHQHFWVFDPAEYPWITDQLGKIRRDYLPADLAPLLRETGFDGCVAVQARTTLEETRWLLQLADENEFIKGVVGWVDLTAADVDEQLGRFDGQFKLKGIRHVLQDEPDDAYMLRPDFRRGIRTLKDRGLVYDLLLFPRHLPYAIELVQEFDDQPFVLDHLAKPHIKEGLLSPWQEEIRRLAAFENVSCKLSGMVTEADWYNWRPADFTPYLDVVLEAFGPKRLLIGSDWPVCTLAGEYRPVMKIVLDYISQLTSAEQEAILGGNAQRIYRLDA